VTALDPASVLRWQLLVENAPFRIPCQDFVRFVNSLFAIQLDFDLSRFDFRMKGLAGCGGINSLDLRR
jgi:hypothetical protein